MVKEQRKGAAFNGQSPQLSDGVLDRYWGEKTTVLLSERSVSGRYVGSPRRISAYRESFFEGVLKTGISQRL